MLNWTKVVLFNSDLHVIHQDKYYKASIELGEYCSHIKLCFLVGYKWFWNVLFTIMLKLGPKFQYVSSPFIIIAVAKNPQTYL